MKKLLLSTAILGASLAVGVVAHADSNVYRLYNHHTGEHFYTTSAAEKNADVKAGWTSEGIGWVAPSSSKTPIYRVFNSHAKGGDHYYTMSKFEASQLVKAGWKWDNGGKPVFYSGGSQAVYVAYNPNAKSGSHNYTKNKAEQNNLLSHGWKYGKTAWYGVASKAPAAPAKPAQPSTPAKPAQPAQPAGKSYALNIPSTSADKMFTVGKDIPAGTYIITLPAGESGMIQSNYYGIHNFSVEMTNPAKTDDYGSNVSSYRVVLEQGKQFDVAYTNVTATASGSMGNKSSGTLAAGEYLVGKDIAPGTYTITAKAGYGDIYTSNSQDSQSQLHSINGSSFNKYIPDKSAKITLNAGDYFVTELQSVSFNK